MSMLEVKDLRVSYGELTILNDVSFSLSKGEWLMLVGPNGAGKSTMINAITQGAKYTGEVLLDGTDVKKLSPKYMARQMGVLTQSHAVGYSFTVEEVVALGRYAHSKGVFAAKSGEDEAMIERALALTGMLTQRGQSVLTLSGGELQRTFLAQVFAQDPSILLLDEPANHLDILYQKQVFGLIREWLTDSEDRAVISVVHDLSLARAYGTRALLLDKGVCIADGETMDVLTPENLSRVYGMDVYAWMRDMLSQWR